jgi:hypothetical protein
MIELRRELTGQRQRIGKRRHWLYGRPVLDGALRGGDRDGGHLDACRKLRHNATQRNAKTRRR